MAAVLGNSGQYNAALAAATRARFLDPTDAMNHRNIAKLHAALGDSRTALKHNLISGKHTGYTFVVFTPRIHIYTTGIYTSNLIYVV
jgi:hypothetical protein